MFYWFKGLLVPWVYQLLKFRTANQKKCLELPAAKSQFGQQFPSGTACGTCQHLRAAWTHPTSAWAINRTPGTNTKCRNVVGFFSSHVLHLFSAQKKGIRKAVRRTAVIEQYFIELDDGKIYRKALYLMVKTMVSCRFSLKPIHWILKAKCPSVFRVQVTVPAELAPEDGHPQPGSDEPALVVANGVRMGKVLNLDHHLYGWKGTPFQTTNQSWYIYGILNKFLYIYIYI